MDTSSRPRVAYLAMMNVFGHDGGVNRALSIIEHCRGLGFDVTLFGLTSGPHVKLDVPALTVPGIGTFSMLRLCARLVGSLRGLDIKDVILSSFGNPINPLMAFALKRMGIRVIYDCQDPPVETTSVVRRGRVSGYLLRAIVSLLDPILARNVDCVLSVSRGVDAILRRRGWRMPIYRYYNGNPWEDKAVEIAPTGHLRNRENWRDAIILIYAGGLQPSFRGIEEQLEAVSIARNTGVNVKFAAFGAGQHDFILECAAATGITEHVHIGNPVSRDHLQAILREANCAEISRVPYGLPNKLFEYLNAGVQVFCSAEMTDIFEVCGDAVVKYDGTTALARLIAASAQKKVDPVAIQAVMERIVAENSASVGRALRAKALNA